LAEIVTTFVDVRLGVGIHAILLAFTSAQASAASYASKEGRIVAGALTRSPTANFFVALGLVPLVRIVSLAMPLRAFPELAWYVIIAVPLLCATWAACVAVGYGRRDIGLVAPWSRRGLCLDLVVAMAGVGIGYMEYRILLPEPLVDRAAAGPVLVAMSVLFVGTGLTEELIFRGVLQRATMQLFGTMPGLLYVSAVFAALHIGHRSLVDVGFVFIVAFCFGWVVRTTGSLLGVVLAHGVTNVCLFVLFPLLSQ